MKYLLLEHFVDGSGVYPEIHVFDTYKERVDKTLILIFGECPVPEHHEREAKAHITELARTGSVEFEGDPGLSWITCEDLRLPGRTLPHQDVTAAWVGALMAVYGYTKDTQTLRWAARDAGLLPLKPADREDLVATIGEERTHVFEVTCNG